MGAAEKHDFRMQEVIARRGSEIARNKETKGCADSSEAEGRSFDRRADRPPSPLLPRTEGLKSTHRGTISAEGEEVRRFSVRYYG